MSLPEHAHRSAPQRSAAYDGTGVDATETMRLIDVERTTDGAFVKFSYLYRVRGTPR